MAHRGELTLLGITLACHSSVVRTIALPSNTWITLVKLGLFFFFFFFFLASWLKSIVTDRDPDGT